VVELASSSEDDAHLLATADAAALSGSTGHVRAFCQVFASNPTTPRGVNSSLLQGSGGL